MDSPVKERLTGALILIAALVIVVPEMLSGPRPRTGGEASSAQSAEAGPPLRTYNLELGSSPAAHAAGQAALTPDTTAPESQSQSPPPTSPALPTSPPPPPVAAVAAVQPDAAPPAASAARPVPAPAAPEQVASAPASATAAATPPVAAPVAPRVAAPLTRSGQWWAQLGSFSSRDNAERLARQLRTAGYTMDVSRVRASGKDLYRVRAGPVDNRAAALALQGRLAAAGHKASLVAP